MLSSCSKVKDYSQFIACCYVNNTNTMQIARIGNISNWYLERVVVPGQRLIFEAPPEAILEISTSTNITSILSEKIPCQILKMDSKITIWSYETVQI